MPILMTQIDGVPDRSLVKPGMAHFAGTGPIGKTCGDCAFRGYYREGKFKFDKTSGQLESDPKKFGGCREYLRLAGSHGSPIKIEYAACKYFSPK
jgi:hypothetical protein